MLAIDRSAHLNRWRRRALTEKLLFAGSLLLLGLLLPPVPAAPAICAVTSLAAVAGAGVPGRLWLACLAAPAGFVLAGSLPLAVALSGDGLAWAPGGLAAAVTVALRAAAGATCLLFLALTTPAPDLVGGLRRLGLPAEVAEVTLLTYRFLFVLGDTAGAMHTAQAARLGHHGMRRRLRSLGVLVATLLPRAFDRAARLEIGLAARGWDGTLPGAARPRPASPLVLAAILAVDLIVLLLGTAGS